VSTLNVDKVDPSTGTALELGTSGDTITVPTGAGLTVVDEVKTNKVSPATGTDFALGDSGDTFTVPSGATIVNSGTATGFGITAASFRPNVNPLIINGNMAVAQRGTSTASVSSEIFGACDRWEHYNTNGGVWTISQEALTADEAYEDGFSYAYKMDCTTASASPSAGDLLGIRYKMEGQDVQLLKKGTPNAEKVTVAFWVKATKTGNNVCNLYDDDNVRVCSLPYTISSTNTWEKKVLNFPADTTGVLTNGNGSALRLYFMLQAGSAYNTGTQPTTWEDFNAVDWCVGQVNHADSTSNNFHVTAVQLEVGEYTSATLPPFQHESYGNNLARCQRYFYRMLDGNAKSAATFSYYSASRVEAGVSFPVTMRTAPSLISTSGASYFRVQRNGGDNNLNDFDASVVGVNSASVSNVDEASGTAGDAGFGYSRANGYLSWNSEL